MKRMALAAICLALGSLTSVTQAQSQPPRNQPPAGQAPIYPRDPRQGQPSQPQQPSRYQVQPAESNQIRRVSGETPVTNQGSNQPGSGANVIRDPNAGNPNYQPQQNVRPSQPNVAGQSQGPLPQGIPLTTPVPQVPQLTPQQEKLVYELLGNWQNSTGNILRFKCDFKRWEYSTFVPKPANPNQPWDAKSFSTGKIHFESPANALFKVNESKLWTPGKNPGDKPTYVSQPEDSLEQWACDGKSVFAFDGRQKVMQQIILPPEMQGQAISDGPLPFLFGAKADKMRARYWFIPVERLDKPDEYWLEAIPKFRGDAANYQKVRVVLDKKDFLPKIMQLFPPNYDEQRNPEYVTYVFENREANWNNNLNKFNPFAEKLFPPKLPAGWTKKVEDPAIQAATPPAGGAGTAQAPPPANNVNR